MTWNILVALTCELRWVIQLNSMMHNETANSCWLSMIKGLQITMFILVVVSSVSRCSNACSLLFRYAPLKFHVATTESPAATMESHAVSTETQRVTMEFRASSMESSWSLHGVPCLHHGIPWETARNSMEFHEKFLAGKRTMRPCVW